MCVWQGTFKLRDDAFRAAFSFPLQRDSSFTCVVPFLSFPLFYSQYSRLERGKHIVGGEIVSQLILDLLESFSKSKAWVVLLARCSESFQVPFQFFDKSSESDCLWNEWYVKCVQGKAHPSSPSPSAASVWDHGSTSCSGADSWQM